MTFTPHFLLAKAAHLLGPEPESSPLAKPTSSATSVSPEAADTFAPAVPPPGAPTKAPLDQSVTARGQEMLPPRPEPFDPAKHPLSDEARLKAEVIKELFGAMTQGDIKIKYIPLNNEIPKHPERRDPKQPHNRLEEVKGRGDPRSADNPVSYLEVRPGAYGEGRIALRPNKQGRAQVYDGAFCYRSADGKGPGVRYHSGIVDKLTKKRGQAKGGANPSEGVPIWGFTLEPAPQIDFGDLFKNAGDIKRVREGGSRVSHPNLCRDPFLPVPTQTKPIKEKDFAPYFQTSGPLSLGANAQSNSVASLWAWSLVYLLGISDVDYESGVLKGLPKGSMPRDPQKFFEAFAFLFDEEVFAARLKASLLYNPNTQDRFGNDLPADKSNGSFMGGPPSGSRRDKTPGHLLPSIEFFGTLSDRAVNIPGLAPFRFVSGSKFVAKLEVLKVADPRAAGKFKPEIKISLELENFGIEPINPQKPLALSFGGHQLTIQDRFFVEKSHLTLRYKSKWDPQKKDWDLFLDQNDLLLSGMNLNIGQVELKDDHIGSTLLAQGLKLKSLKYRLAGPGNVDVAVKADPKSPLIKHLEVSDAVSGMSGFISDGFFSKASFTSKAKSGLSVFYMGDVFAGQFGVEGGDVDSDGAKATWGGLRGAEVMIGEYRVASDAKAQTVRFESDHMIASGGVDIAFAEKPGEEQTVNHIGADHVATHLRNVRFSSDHVVSNLNPNRGVRDRQLSFDLKARGEVSVTTPAAGTYTFITPKAAEQKDLQKLSEQDPLWAEALAKRQALLRTPSHRGVQDITGNFSASAVNRTELDPDSGEFVDLGATSLKAELKADLPQVNFLADNGPFESSESTLKKAKVTVATGTKGAAQVQVYGDWDLRGIFNYMQPVSLAPGMGVAPGKLKDLSIQGTGLFTAGDKGFAMEADNRDRGDEAFKVQATWLGGAFLADSRGVLGESIENLSSFVVVPKGDLSIPTLRRLAVNTQEGASVSQLDLEELNIKLGGVEGRIRAPFTDGVRQIRLEEAEAGDPKAPQEIADQAPDTFWLLNYLGVSSAAGYFGQREVDNFFRAASIKITEPGGESSEPILDVRQAGFSFVSGKAPFHHLAMGLEGLFILEGPKAFRVIPKGLVYSLRFNSSLGGRALKANLGNMPRLGDRKK